MALIDLGAPSKAPIDIEASSNAVIDLGLPPQFSL